MINLYAIGNEDYEKNGDLILEPISGTIRQIAGGGYDLTMEIPYHETVGMYRIAPGAVVKVPVPLETIPNAFVGQDMDVYKTNTNASLREEASEPTTITYSTWSAMTAYSVGDKVTYNSKNYKCTYFDATSGYMQVPPNNSSWWSEIARYTSGSPVLVTLPTGSEIYLIESYNTTWYKMSTYYGLEGYIKKSQVDFYKHVDAGEIEAHQIHDQLFRIKEVNVDETGKTASITGQHVSYDLAGILVQDISMSQCVPATAISRIVASFMMSYRGEIATDLTSDDNGTYTGEIKGKNGIYCLLDPDRGIVPQFDAKLIRDNWDIYIMAKDSSATPVYTIEYGNNAKGITWKRSSTNIVTRIVPVAKAEGGEDYYLPETYIDSEDIDDYPVIIMERLNVDGQVGKAKSKTDDTVWTESALKDEMRAKAGERFSVDKVDQVLVEITVQVEQLGDTAKYAWLKGREPILLYDKVRVKDRLGALNVVAEVTELEYDIVKRKITGIKISNVCGRAGRTVTGYNVQDGSIGMNKLMNGVVQDIVQQAVYKMPEYH